MDSLLEAIRAAPDDDEPRLVWADREGGERGELVVLQCQIAARAGTRADRVRMQARVRELLPRFQGEDETFVRGFVERARVEIDAIGPALFERHPVLRDVEIRDFIPSVRPASYEEISPEEVWAQAMPRFTAAFDGVPPGRIWRLEVTAEINERGDYAYPDDEHPYGDAFVAIIAAMPALADLRGLRVIGGGLSIASLPHLARLSLEALQGGSRLTGVDAVALLREAPTLHRFGPWNSSPPLAGNDLETLLGASQTRQLRELDLWANELAERDLIRIAATPFAALESLGVGMSKLTPHGLAALATSPHLAASLIDLNIYVHGGMASPARFCQAPFALQRLRLSSVDDAIVAALEQAAELERIRVDTISPAHLERLRATIPLVNDGGW